MNLTIRPVSTIKGALRPPSDKSLTHRAYLFASVSDGPCVVDNPLRGQDCEATLECLAQMGLTYTWESEARIRLRPSPNWVPPSRPLNCGNSGTTMRLLSGLVASRPISATLVGDASLSRRPMSRIAKPLRLMGAGVEGDTPPLRIEGTGSARAIRYESPVASAQIKSCILLAGLKADGETCVFEPSPSRDHTERMLRAMGASVISIGGQGPITQPNVSLVHGHEVRLTPPDHLAPFTLNVPGDISSAAFFMVAAALFPDGELVLKELSVNPTRTGILDILEQVGLRVELENLREELGEPVADVRICRDQSPLNRFEISGSMVPRLIDEIPILAILATQCQGVSRIRDAAELRVKESDRIELIATGLREMGAEVETHSDGMSISGPTPLLATKIQTHLDHRIAMGFAVAGLIAKGHTVIEGAECIATSFPTFEQELVRLTIA